MHRVLLIIFLVGLAGIALGWLLGRVKWTHAWVVSAAANLVVRLGVLIVFVGIAVVGFRRGGYFVALGVLFTLLSLGALVVYHVLGSGRLWWRDVRAVAHAQTG